MPDVTITVPEHLVLEGMSGLQYASMRLAEQRTALVTKVKGGKVIVPGGARATVVDVGAGQVTVAKESGQKELLQLTPALSKRILPPPKASTPRPRSPGPHHPGTTTRK